MSEIKVDDASFQQEVLQAALPVIVDFWAPWCAPCKMIAPLIEQIALEYAGQIMVAKVNVDDSPEVASRYQVMSIPTLLFIKSGEVVEQTVGAVSKDVIIEKIKQHFLG